MKIPPTNIDTWMHRTYNNNVLVKAEHGDYLVSITPEGWYKSYHVVSLLGDEGGYDKVASAAVNCRIHAIAMFAIATNLPSFEVFTSEMLKLANNNECDNG